MDGLPPQVQERLQQLSAQFRSGLSEKLAEIRGLWARSVNGEVDALRSLRYQVHRLAGSAATFGFDEITDRARTVEECVEQDLSAGGGSVSADTSQALQRLVDADEIPVQSDESVQPIDDEGVRKFVILAGEVTGIGDTFAEQLAVFGLTLITVREPAEIDSLLSSATEPDQPDFAYAVFFATVRFLASRLRRLSELTSLRDTYTGRFFTVLVGDEDDFESRLRSVRYGADAFLAVPVDVTQLVDRVETLMSDREAEPYHVLIVDDDPDQVSSTALILQNAGMITSVVTDPRNIFRVMVEYQPELILMDMYMPDCTGAELAGIIRQNDNFVGIPIVFLSVETDPEKQLAAVEAGGDGFLVKPFNRDHLVASVRHRAARMRAMRFYMERDSLTGLLNHTNLKARLETDLARARRVGTDMVFAMIDIDHFKSVNDTYGHLTGDRVLKGLARLLQDRLRRTDVVGRYGGEEFGVILFNTDSTHAQRLMNELRDSFSRLLQSNGEAQFRVTFSCGVAAFPTFETASDLNEAADGALYRAKELGRNQVVAATEHAHDDSMAGSS
ncbi:MAG TPA: diguanylate cyclase [Alkalispirochaeta sp.]|nr:diguanylate cyclase [Alkalispirochaeta sp.]